MSENQVLREFKIDNDGTICFKVERDFNEISVKTNILRTNHLKAFTEAIWSLKDSIGTLLFTEGFEFGAFKIMLNSDNDKISFVIPMPFDFIKADSEMKIKPLEIMSVNDYRVHIATLKEAMSEPGRSDNSILEHADRIARLEALASLVMDIKSLNNELAESWALICAPDTASQLKLFTS